MFPEFVIPEDQWKAFAEDREGAVVGEKTAAFALVMGLVGGVPPSIRAARAPVVVALREL